MMILADIEQSLITVAGQCAHDDAQPALPCVHFACTAY